MSELGCFFRHALHSTPTTIPHRAQQGNGIPQTQIDEDDYCQRRYECQELFKIISLCEFHQ